MIVLIVSFLPEDAADRLRPNARLSATRRAERQALRVRNGINREGKNQRGLDYGASQITLHCNRNFILNSVDIAIIRPAT